VNRTAEIVVVGGGITGAAIAYHLARRGAKDILLLDAHYSDAATRRSAAIVRTVFADPVLGFLARLSFEHFAAWRDLVGASCNFQQTGVVIIVPSSDMSSLIPTALEADLLLPRELSQLLPWYRPQGDIVPLLDTTGGTADPRLARNNLLAAAKRLGVRLETNIRVQKILVSQGRIRGLMTCDGTVACNTVVLATGVWTPLLLASIGRSLPITTTRTTLVVLESNPMISSVPLIDLVSGLLVRSYHRRAALVGTRQVVPSSDDCDQLAAVAPMDIVKQLMSVAHKFHSTSIRYSWHGCYDMTPDGRPFLGPLADLQGLFIAAGFSGGGFKLAPAVGLLLAELVTEGRTSLDLAPFSTSRLITRRAFTDFGLRRIKEEQKHGGQDGF